LSGICLKQCPAGSLRDIALNKVTAVGYDFDADTKAMAIYLYDPNHPGEEPTLTLNLANPASGHNLSQSTGEPLRGFFVINYQPQAPG
jgi:hypothetical protein